MFNIKGQVCDVCGKPFDKDSDIVVCPDCGTPHHRECWHQLGHCINEDKHNSDFEWKPVVQAAPEQENGIKCPDCGAIMPQGTLFCENCGRSLNTQKAGTQIYNVPGGRMEVHRFPSPYNMSADEYKDRVDRELAGEIDGVPYRDMAVFIGPNAQYYIYKFKRMRQNPKYRPFNATAFLFPPIWLLFRKLWKHAIIAAVINFVLNLPTFILLAVEAGVISAGSSLVFPGIQNVANITSLLVLAVGVLWGFLAIPLYRKDTVKRLKKLKEDAMGDMNTYYRSVMENAGPSKVGMIVVVIFSMLYIYTLLGF
ncbi:MAG: DUF2628 domain-containing protein [Oscillospiraceae bacterium]|nr:DUF2628 domain-containing protein [Oscillospiraceae bacterium]